MPSVYDEMSPRAYPDYTGGTAEARQRRDLLRAAMEHEGFIVEPNEWWHFNYKDWQAYPILDIPFAEIKPARASNRQNAMQAVLKSCRASQPRGKLKNADFVIRRCGVMRPTRVCSAMTTVTWRSSTLGSRRLSPSPLLEMPRLAAALGIGSLLVKDESHRFGLEAFKAVGVTLRNAQA